uniref:Uncharacterized protein n=1 Tax=Trypanosoma vivax (strain Y486) TaxID=1055687 RepID=G0TR92_TRYVY|nr:hypothetical protein, unlikely [Trypanosoma vivax Y486]
MRTRNAVEVGSDAGATKPPTFISRASSPVSSLPIPQRHHVFLSTRPLLSLVLLFPFPTSFHIRARLCMYTYINISHGVISQVTAWVHSHKLSHSCCSPRVLLSLGLRLPPVLTSDNRTGGDGLSETCQPLSYWSPFELLGVSRPWCACVRFWRRSPPFCT